MGRKKKEVKMSYTYTCKCGYEVVIHTDLKAPDKVKCKECKEQVQVEDQGK